MTGKDVTWSQTAGGIIHDVDDDNETVPIQTFGILLLTPSSPLSIHNSPQTNEERGVGNRTDKERDVIDLFHLHSESAREREREKTA